MRLSILTSLCLLIVSPANAQSRGDQDSFAEPAAQQSAQPVRRDDQNGSTAQIGNGRIGLRQTREEAAPNVKPLARIQSRIASRVQSRLRTRIDRNYDPQANATSPFETASDQARVAGRPR